MTKTNENEKFELAGNEFLVSPRARKILRLHIGQIRRKHRFNPSVRKELLEALRDVLLEVQKKPSKTINEDLALDAIAMTGDSYETQSNLSIVVGKTVAKLHKLKLMKRLIRFKNNKRATKWVCLAFATVLLIPLTTIAFWSASFYSIYNPSTDDATTYMESPYGSVKFGDYFREKSIDESLVDPYTAQYQELTGRIAYENVIAVCIVLLNVLLIMFFITLAYRKKAWKLFGLSSLVVLITIGVSVYATESTRREYEQYINSTMSYRSGTPPPTYTGRTATDLDTLYACGAEIQTVYSPQNDNMFYALKDAGFGLAREIANYEKVVPPKSDFCKAYSELRETYDNKAIVVQDYFQDSDGVVRAVDQSEQFNLLGNAKTTPAHKMGFFVKSEEIDTRQ